MKLAIISRHPAPYRDPFLRQISRDRRFRVEIFNEMDLDAGHDFWDLKQHGYLARPLYRSRSGLFGRLLCLFRRFVFGDYDFVLWAGFNAFELTVAMFFSAILKRRYGFMADTIEQRRTSAFKRFVKRMIARRASLIFVPGRRGVEFWVQNYGIDASRIAKGLYALDGDVLSRDIEMLRKRRRELRVKLGIAESERVYLMVANMIPTRHYPITVAGFLEFARQNRDVRFVIVGRGPELEKMQETANAHPEIVVVPGCSFDDMKALYALADIYVHGGTEPASTAIVIGAIAGLPILSSEAVGCAADVLEDGKSGVRVSNYLSVDAWCEGFRKMMDEKSRWVTMGAYARELSRKLDVEEIYPRFVEKALQT